VQTFTDVESGAVSERPGLGKALAELTAGDTLVVTRLDRAGRSARALLELANEMQERGVHLRSLREVVDTSTAHGRLFFTLTSAFAEFEREAIIERTKSGQAAARARGVKFGRPRVTAANPRVLTVLDLVAAGRSVRDAAEGAGVSESTARRYLRIA
jgi:DNA invertase Pin-like site-specific DNA recombinase